LTLSKTLLRLAETLPVQHAAKACHFLPNAAVAKHPQEAVNGQTFVKRHHKISFATLTKEKTLDGFVVANA